jgi:hypothetical protein
VSAAARTMGHWISFGITLALMLLVGAFLFRTSAYGHRSGLIRWRRWGPLTVFCFAVPLIMADLVRHMLQVCLGGGGAGAAARRACALCHSPLLPPCRTSHRLDPHSHPLGSGPPPAP